VSLLIQKNRALSLDYDVAAAVAVVVVPVSSSELSYSSIVGTLSEEYAYKL